MRVLGIDPGLTASGYGIVDTNGKQESLAEAGVIRPAGRELSLRLASLHRSMIELLEQWRPEVLVIEEVYSKYSHPRTAILMAHARGAMCVAAGSVKLPVVHYAASEVRRALTGNGRASERQVREMVCRRLGLATPRGGKAASLRSTSRTQAHDDHVYDALALALCHAGRARGAGTRPAVPSKTPSERVRRKRDRR